MRKNSFLIMVLVLLSCGSGQAQKFKFTIGGYGEAVAQRMFYSDNVQRYEYPESNKEASHGRFDLPHVNIQVAYDFGKGWKMASELEYEHGGTGATYEIEREETGEYEKEIEKGGEVSLEQFWLEKTFSQQAHLRMGHLVIPIGLTNRHHLPNEFFSVLRPEEETALIPCTWHQSGISFWGSAANWHYNAILIAGLDAERFNNANWIQGGATSPYEFEIANSYAGAFRLDNTTIPDLRLGVSGYFGYSAPNSLKWERYKNAGADGELMLGTFDATYKAHNIWARANLLYGHLNDFYTISTINKNLPSASPSPRTNIASDVLSYYIEAGYDVFGLCEKTKNRNERLYIYGHYGFYDSMYKTDRDIPAKGWSKKTIFSGGINYYPLKEVVIKAEYAFRKLDKPYNSEPTLSLGVAYAGWFN